MSGNYLILKNKVKKIPKVTCLDFPSQRFPYHSGWKDKQSKIIIKEGIWSVVSA